MRTPVCFRDHLCIRISIHNMNSSDNCALIHQVKSCLCFRTSLPNKPEFLLDTPAPLMFWDGWGYTKLDNLCYIRNISTLRWM
jgi:hypothetical protein